MTDLISWWSGSALQVGILVSLFWLALVVCILAICGSNRRSRDMSATDVYDIHRVSAPMPLEPWRKEGAL